MDAGKGEKDGDQKQEQEAGDGTKDAVRKKAPPTKPIRSSARLRNQILPVEVFNNYLLKMDAEKGNKEGDQPSGQGQIVGGAANGTVNKKAPRTKPIRSSARLRNQWLPFEVFDNELLRKKILGYAVFSGENEADIKKTACSLRLVGKLWNETVIKLLYKRQEPLITLSTGDNENGKLFESFCNIFSMSIPMNGCIIPFSLQIDYLWSENINAFWNLLTHCGQGLVQLKIERKTRWLSCKGQFPTLSLPRLHKLEIFMTWYPNVTAGNVNPGQDGEETALPSLLNSVARDGTSIAKFKMSLEFLRNGVRGTSFLTNLPLPTTINNLQLLGWLRDKDLEVLTRKSLPNLTWLQLALGYDSLGNGSFSKILENYRVSLRKLIILDFSEPTNQPILFRFPIMEALESFFFGSAILDLEPGRSLGKYLPKLRVLSLDCQRAAAMLRKWTENAEFISVAALQISLGNALNMEKMQRVNFAFPNVKNLDLNFSGTETSGLKYLFREMTQLTTLKLKFGGSEPEVNSDFWDSVLTGISLEIIAEFRHDPGFWERFDMNEVDALGSIRNLKNLTMLILFGYGQPYRIPPYISDITFQRALFMMPNLETLNLHGRFKASAEMAEEWMSGGRLLEYSD